MDHFRVQVRIHPKARHLTLRYDTRQGCFTLTKPRRFDIRSIEEFLNENCEWMRHQASILPTVKPVMPGSQITLEGKAYTLVHRDATGVKIEPHGDDLVVMCRLDRFPRALQRYLKKRAEEIIVPMAHAKAAGIKKEITRIQFKDTRSRWGSCARGGKLSFSWRLIMAPMEVIDYIVGHEVAHLAQHNHSQKFWDLCRQTTPYTDIGKAWLDTHGLELHQMQFTSTAPDSSRA